MTNSVDAKAITSMKYLLDDVMDYWKKRIERSNDPDELEIITMTLDLWEREMQKSSDMLTVMLHDRVMELIHREIEQRRQLK